MDLRAICGLWDVFYMKWQHCDHLLLQMICKVYTRKVCAGVFERIPSIYSNDLAATISSLLKVDPDKRPNTDELLSNPAVRKCAKK